ncbi:hypothetical protein ACU686_04505 [Yinghuangia aomiensis]
MNSHGGPFDVVTLGETMALLSAPRIGPSGHARSLDVAVGGAELERRGRADPAGAAGRLARAHRRRRVRASRARHLAGEGVDVSGAVVDPGAPTGLMVKARRTNTSTEVTYYRAGSAGSRLCRKDVDAALLRGACVLHVTGITPRCPPRRATRWTPRSPRRTPAPWCRWT